VGAVADKIASGRKINKGPYVLEISGKGGVRVKSKIPPYFNGVGKTPLHITSLHRGPIHVLGHYRAAMVRKKKNPGQKGGKIHLKKGYLTN